MTNNKEWKDGACPFCLVERIERKADCFSKEGTKICELWFCLECAGFFPRMINLGDEAVKDGKSKKGSAPGEKRRTPRFPVQFVVQIDFDEEKRRQTRGRAAGELSEPLIAMVLDAGVGGLCFRYPAAVAEGREGMMRISLPSVNRSFSAKGRVVRSTRLPDGSYGLGVQFVDVEPEYREALKRYVDFEAAN
jgi:hypothetical protein